MYNTGELVSLWSMILASSIKDPEFGSQTRPWASLLTQMVKNLPAMWETWVQSPSWEDPLEKATTTHTSILPGESQWTEVHGGL